MSGMAHSLAVAVLLMGCSSTQLPLDAKHPAKAKIQEPRLSGAARVLAKDFAPAVPRGSSHAHHHHHQTDASQDAEESPKEIPEDQASDMPPPGQTEPGQTDQADPKTSPSDSNPPEGHQH